MAINQEGGGKILQEQGGAVDSDQPAAAAAPLPAGSGSNGIVTQVGVETMRSVSNPPTHVTQVGLEVIRRPQNATAHVTQVGVETLRTVTTTRAMVTQIGIEVMRRKVPQTLVVTIANATVPINSTQQYSAYLLGSDGSTSSASVVWSTTAGTISSTGLLTPDQKIGTYYVTATETNGNLVTTVAVDLVCPPATMAQTTPNAPTILSVSQASTRNVDGSTTSLLAFGVVQDRVTGSSPIAQLRLYRGLTATGPFSLPVDDETISQVVVVNQMFDKNPLFGQEAYYVATAVDSKGVESGYSNVVTYTASRILLGLYRGTLSAGAFGPYPVLGSDCYLDPTTREGVIGPNGDLLAVNSLECLAQDLRIRILTSLGELPMHPTFGLVKGKLIGTGQATRAAQAIVLVADIKDMLRKEPRVYKTLDVTINQTDAYSWIIGYDIMAINFEDPVRLNMVYPFYQQAA